MTLSKKFEFLRPQDVLKVCFFGPTFGPIYPRRSAKSKKSKYLNGKNLSIGISEYAKIKALSGPNFSGKIRLLFAPFWLFFLVKKGAWSKVKGSESKYNLAYARAMTPGV